MRLRRTRRCWQTYEKSGITDKKIIKQLGVRALTRAETGKRTGLYVRSYAIPYLWIDGTPMTWTDSGGTQRNYYRLKLLEKEYIQPGDGKVIELGKQKYWQPPGSPVRLYFPPLTFKWGLPQPKELAHRRRNWEMIVRDTDQYIVITEGEKKAICGCLHSIPTVALGGVNSFLDEERQLLVT